MTASTTRVNTSRFYVWVALLAGVTTVGLAAIVMGFIQGHEVSFNTTTGVPWGILISSYLFFVLPASGLCLLSALGHVGGVERFKPLSRRAVLLAIALLLAGFLVIASDLERPWLIALYIILTPNPTSPMWWMGTLYAVYFIVLLAEFFLLCRTEAIERLRTSTGKTSLVWRLLALGAQPDLERAHNRSHAASRIAGTMAAVLAVAALSTLGAVFGFTGSRSLWYGPLIPLYFILSALLAGSAILCLASILSGKPGGIPAPRGAPQAIRSLGRLLLVLLGAFFLFTFLNLLTAQYGRIPEEYDSVMVLIRGPLAASFWVGEVVVGLLVPMAILALTRARATWGLVAAPALVVVGMFFARYNFVVAGQLVPLIGREELWEYAPGAVEILTIVGAAALSLLLYSIGNRVLPLDDAVVPTVETEEEAAPQVPRTAPEPARDSVVSPQ
jgi:molybdopterin-containing oxidoreductase family membrane subunit